MAGLFVTFEGGDGVGKSTQAGLLATAIEATGRSVVRTREPGGTDLGVQLRQLLQHQPGHIDPRAEALLYAADRAHHIATVVRPALEAGAVVLQDRYLDSSVAYQGAGRILQPEAVRDLSLWATDGLLPDVTILLDLDPEVGAVRRAGGVYDRMEAESLDFHRRVRDGYLALAAAAPQRFLVVDAEQTPDAIAEQVAARVLPLLG